MKREEKEEEEEKENSNRPPSLSHNWMGPVALRLTD